MKHEVYIDEDKIMFLRIKGELSLDDARECLDALTSKMDGPGPYPMLIDLTGRIPGLDKEVRKYLAEQNKDPRINKQAYVITNPMVRMVARIVVAAQDSADNARFFKTPEEALGWLNERT